MSSGENAKMWACDYKKYVVNKFTSRQLYYNKNKGNNYVIQQLTQNAALSNMQMLHWLEIICLTPQGLFGIRQLELRNFGIVL